MNHVMKAAAPDQHGEGIVVEIAGLQPHHVAGHVEHACRDAIRTKAVDEPAVAALPEQTAEPLGRPDEDQVVKLVEIPLVEQEAIKPVVLARELDRNIGPTNIELPGDQEADQPSSTVGRMPT